jgi:hypothetical protein
VTETDRADVNNGLVIAFFGYGHFRLQTHKTFNSTVLTLEQNLPIFGLYTVEKTVGFKRSCRIQKSIELPQSRSN